MPYARAVSEFMPEAAAREYLAALRSTARYDMVAMFLTEKDEKELQQIERRFR